LFRLNPKWRKRLLKLLVLAVLLWAGWWLGLKMAPPPNPYTVRPAGVRVLDRHGSLLRGFLSPDQKRRWRLELDDFSPELVAAVLHHEDRWFYRHPGVNPAAVVRAAWGNLRAGRVTSGASTITMQLARLTEPRPRTLAAKIHQVMRALQYESLYSKDQILTMYLNLAPYGGNAEGVGAAAHVFFNKPAVELSWAEACLLAILPQSPNRHNPVGNPDLARSARDGLAHNLQKAGIIDQQIHEEILSSPLPGHRHRQPFQAPHFSRWSRQRHPGRVTLRTTLDAGMQNRAEEIVAARVRQLRPLGIQQAAVVVLDSRNSEIVTMVGSAGFSDELNQGQVNGAVAPRSPGSTLKPLVYALAFDRGLTTADALIEDVPRWFSDYSPKNYDGKFRGVVKVGDALRRSLNVPAVTLAAELELSEAGGLHAFLKDAGVKSLDQPSGHYGLTLVLGGGEVTLLELASLYGLLARQGMWLPTRDLLPDKPLVDPGRRLMGAGATWLTMQELTGVDRPDPELLWQGTSRRFDIPWKTGTSYGHRDAWSVGIAGPWVVAVWLGNFAGEGSPHLTGGEVAAPLLFSLIEGLSLDEPGAWHQRPDGVAERQICALSGSPCGDHCGPGVTGFHLPGISPSSTCSIHRAVEVDVLTGQTVCSRCRGDRLTHEQSVEWWPPQVASYLVAGGLALPNIPAHNPDCPAFGVSEAPIITSPQPGSEYFLRRGVPLVDQAMALEASFSTSIRQVWWFADGVLLKVAEPGERVFFVPTVGRHEFTVVDDAGRSGSLVVWVRGAG
jgi:penicillin-binding protein 1C